MSRKAFYALIAGAVLSAAALAALFVFKATAFGGETAPTQADGPYRGSEPPPGIQLPRFTLRDVIDGSLISSQSLRGRTVLVTFLDSDCRAQCPIIAGQLGSALKRMSSSDRRRVTAIAVSVNPRIDTRASVVRFLRQHHALGQVRYLSGDLPDLRRAWKAFQIVSAYETGNADIHSADVRVFDPAGVWVATLHAGVDLTPENLAHDILTALASGN